MLHFQIAHGFRGIQSPFPTEVKSNRKNLLPNYKKAKIKYVHNQLNTVVSKLQLNLFCQLLHHILFDVTKILMGSVISKYLLFILQN